jgi:hypothetical protein
MTKMERKISYYSNKALVLNDPKDMVKPLNLPHARTPAAAAAAAEDGPTWMFPTPTRTFDNGCGTVHEIDPSMIADGIHCNEQIEFNFAAYQLMRLCGVSKTVSKVEVYNSPKVEAKWLQKKQELATIFKTEQKNLKMVWVFHGTGADVMKIICETGFRVARGSEIRIGALHGIGVYTATGPDTPMIYAAGPGSSGGSVILSQALIGREGKAPDNRMEAPDDVDSWAACGDYRIFRDASLVLPKYIIHYS